MMADCCVEDAEGGRDPDNQYGNEGWRQKKVHVETPAELEKRNYAVQQAVCLCATSDTPFRIG